VQTFLSSKGLAAVIHRKEEFACNDVAQLGSSTARSSYGLLFTELNIWLTDVAGKKMLLIVDRQLEQQAAAQLFFCCLR
jgi:hypothetical protein